MKTISAGILVKCGDTYVIGHATGNAHFDIFKGKQEEGESLIQTALRECQEESSLVFNADDILYVDTFNYTKKKNLALFLAKIDQVNLDELKCSTFYDKKPEMDYYIAVDFDTLLLRVSSGMKAVLSPLKTLITEY